MIEFLRDTKDYGLKIALGNQLVHFTKWFVGAKRIRLSYWPDHGRKYVLNEIHDLQR